MHAFPRLLAGLVLMVIGSLALAQVNVSLDRAQGAVGVPFLLTLEATQGTSEEPDLSPLEDQFTVLGSRRSALSSFRNGRSEVIQRWLITLAPRLAGDLEIPALQVGTEFSQPLSFSAQANTDTTSASLALETSLSLPMTYQRSAVTLSVRLFYRDRLARGEITEPMIDQVLIYPLGDQRFYKESRQGQPFDVIEQRYVLIPEASGQYRIPVLEFSGMNQQGDTLYTRSRPLVFDALPWPNSARGAQLAATELTVNEQWQPLPEDIRAGDTLLRTITIDAHNVPAAWIPRPELRWPEGVRAFPQAEIVEERIDNGVLVSRLTLPIQLLFTNSGQVILPGVSIPWWDLAREQLDESRIPPVSVRVDSFISPPSATPAPQPSAEPETAVIQSARSIRTEADSSNDWLGWFWALVALVCAAGWSLARARSKQLEQQLADTQKALEQKSAVRAVDELRERELQAFSRLEQCCRYGDADKAYDALLEWARAFWPNQPVSGLGDIESLANAPTLTYLLRNLDHRLRNHDDDEPWHGDLTLDQIARLRRRHGERPVSA